MKIRKLALAATLTALSAALPMAQAEGIRVDPESGSSSSSRTGAAGSDVVISAKIRSAMAGDDRFKQADIDVQTVNGTVVLTGSANSEEAARAAEDLARGVEGVNKVDNRIAVPSTRNTVREDARGAMDQTSRAASDSWITTKVKSSLISDSITKGRNIGVKTMGGVVHLTGNVEAQVEYDRAIQVARDIEGVREVDASGLRVTGKK